MPSSLHWDRKRGGLYHLLDGEVLVAMVEQGRETRTWYATHYTDGVVTRWGRLEDAQRHINRQVARG